MSNPQLRQTLQRVGQITVCWNDIEQNWYLIYTILVHELPRNKADVMYRQFRTSAAQREFIQHIAGVAFDAETDLLKAIGKLKTRTDEIAGMRRDVAHADFGYEVDDMEHPMQSVDLRVAPGSRSLKPNRYAGKKLSNELVSVINAMRVHERELEDFRRRLLREHLPPEKRPPQEWSKPLPPRDDPQ